MMIGCILRQQEVVVAMLAVVQYSAADFANRVVDMGPEKVVFVVRVVAPVDQRGERYAREVTGQVHSGPYSDRQALAEIVVEQRSIGWDQTAPVEEHVVDLYTYLGLELHADVVGLHNSSGLGLMALEAPVTAVEPR